MNKLKVITLFSGYDSQCLALERLKRDYPPFDYELVAWCEIDPHAIRAHNALFPQWADRNLGDISQVAAANVPDCDLMTWSFPCTDISSAGRQQGLSKDTDTRSSLCWEAMRIFKHKKPRYLLMENVADLTYKKFAADFLAIQRELDSYGYTNHWQLLNARDFGVPQNRLRVFMVSILGFHQPYYFPKPFPLEKRLKDVLEKNVPEKYYLSAKRVQGLVASMKKEKDAGRGFKFAPKTGDEDVDSCVSTHIGGRKTDNSIIEPQQ